MVAGEVCCGFFHELKLHLQFPGFPFELAQPCTFADGQRRFLAGVLTAVYANPVSEGAFVDTELLRHSGDRARRLDHRGRPGRTAYMPCAVAPPAAAIA